MGPRPPDFDEQLVRQSPTFIKWSTLNQGEKLRYACREFIKGYMDDEERLMRRIMIARRNNLKDHQALKRARELTSEELSGVKANATDGEGSSTAEPAAKVTKSEASDTPGTSSGPIRKRRPATMFNDTEVAREMDVAAVEATRSYRTWQELADGAVFIYNQKYIKGREGHDWLLRKNIWRRMRYRRENKKMVEKLRDVHGPPPSDPSVNRTSTNSQSNAKKKDTNDSTVASEIIDRTLIHPEDNGKDQSNETAVKSEETQASSLPMTATTGLAPTDDDMTQAVEAAVAVAESYTRSEHYKNAMVQNPLDTAASSAALDAAAKLAASAGVDEEAVAAATAATMAQSLNE